MNNSEIAFPHLDETVAVIGSGIAGCLTANVLSSSGYNVSIFESSEEMFSGASSGALQAHLGGLYSGSIQTAQECLTSAIELKKSMPYAFNGQNAQFLVADQSEISMEDYTNFYNQHTDYYASLPIDDQVFGPPESFYSVLDAHELSFVKNVEGGISTHEPGLNINLIRSVLLNELDLTGVKQFTKSNVVGAEKIGEVFNLYVDSGSAIENMKFDQVINAGGYRARFLDNEFGDRTEYNLYLKSWSIVQKKEGQKRLPPFYVVRGDFMHHCPIGNNGLASIIVANDDGSYLDTLQFSNEKPCLPDEWMNILSSGVIPESDKRQKQIMDYASEMFLNDVAFNPVMLVPGVAVSYSPARQDKTKRSVNIVTNGWQTLVPTKATNAIELAKEAKANAVEHSLVKLNS